MTGTLHILGTGPGDPELLTLKAADLLRRTPVIAAPRGAADGESTALNIVRAVVDISAKEIVELHFPMKKVRLDRDPDPVILAAWRQAADTVLGFIDRGLDVCFPTLGDPAIYSTGYYLYETICGLREDLPVRFIPGVSAMSSCSASIGAPICLGDETVAVIPATFADHRIEQVLHQFDTIVLMKVHRVLDRITRLLAAHRLLDRAVLIERAGTAEERVIERIDRIDELSERPHYYSTIIIRKQPVRFRTLIN